MEMTLERSNNTNIINMIPSATIREHLIKTEIEFTALEQLSIIKNSMVNLQQKKEEYLKYAMDWRRDVSNLALRYLGEICLLESIVQDKSGSYQFMICIEHSEAKPVDSFQSIIPLINYFDMSKERLNTYKVNIFDLEDELVAQIWVNNKYEIIMFTIEHIDDVAEGIDLDTLPFEHLQVVWFIKEMDDGESYLYIDLEKENISMNRPVDAVPIILERKYNEKHTKSELISNIQLVSNIVIE